ncbi:MAG: peptidoglycan DD-metalloendopeptidase family protein [Polyangiaceae bacterium]|nr:peptidoglycan DD-metalloendopeptidase family protein [Polyangiaceae bacterium]
MAAEEVDQDSAPPASTGTRGPSSAGTPAPGRVRDSLTSASSLRGSSAALRKPPLPPVGGAEMSPRRRVLEARIPVEPEPGSPEAAETPRSGLSATSMPDTLEPAALSLRSPGASGAPSLRRPSLTQGELAGPASPRASANASMSRWLGRDGKVQDRGAASVPRGGSALAMSPRMTALFGGLFGLATVTTIIALLIQGAPPRDDRSAALATGTSSAAAEGASGDEAAAQRGPKKRQRTKIPGPWRIADIAKDPGVRIAEDTMGRRSFITALGEKGVPKDQVYRVLKAFDGLRKFDKTGKNDKFIVALDRQDNHVRAFEYVVSGQEIYQAKETDGILTASQLDMKIAEEEVVGSFYVSKNVARSMEWGGFEPDLARVIDEAFAGKTSVDGFEEGGIVRVVATEVTALGEFVRYKNIVALEYKPPDPQATPLRAYTYQGPGARGYFDDRGRQPDGSGWGSPVPGAPITSRFNPKRMHPVLKKVMPHNGTDYGAPTGTPIYAVFRGKLTHVGPAGPCGNMIAIMHPNGVESGYCHMSKIAPGLKVGGTVGTRQNIGQVGTTGRSTGPHLHFWTKKGGKFFDSETLKIDGFRVIPSDERAAFQARKSELDARLEGIELPEPPPAEPAAKASSAPAGDDTRPNVGAGSEDDEPGSAAPPAGSASPKADSKPMQIDPGDGDEIVGADLKK